MNKIIATVLLAVISIPVFSQPVTEIYLFDLTAKGKKLTISKPRNITNHKGYDNQPFFHTDYPVLYYASADEEGRTNIKEYNYKSTQTRQLTLTSDREYSPRLTEDKQFLSCILQRDNGAQDLVKYPVNSGPAQIIVDNMIVGYHAWGDENNVVVFTLPQPFKLHLLNIKTGRDTVVAEQIGRSLHKIPGKNAVSFIQKISDDQWMINSLDINTRKITGIVKSLPGKEHDMTWTPDGKIIMSDEKKIFFLDPKKSTVWTEIKIKSNTPLNTITRLAVSPDGKLLAVVVNE